MPHHQALRPTLGDFIELVTTAHGCTLRTRPGTLTGPKGRANVRYLLRESRPILILPDMPDSQRLTATMLSNFCRTLDLEVEDFGVEGEAHPPLPH